MVTCHGTIGSGIRRADMICFFRAKIKSLSLSLKRPLLRWTSYILRAMTKVSANFGADNGTLVCLFRRLLTRYLVAAWHTISPRESLLRLVARVSSRVFLGKEICRNEDWLRVTREYTVSGFRAAEKLRLWPALLRPLVHWFLPSCQRARADVAEARRIISKVLEDRRLQQQRGEKIHYEDAVEWYVVSSPPLLPLLLFAYKP